MGGDKTLQVGKILAVFGIRGSLKIFSYTEPKSNILVYPNWLLKKDGQVKQVKVLNGQVHGKGIIANLEGISSRELAETLLGFNIFIEQTLLPPTQPNQYYWADLIGLVVENLEGISLGRIDSLFETGANDILLVKGDRERAIPFLHDSVIKKIDLEQGKMLVDWDANF